MSHGLHQMKHTAPGRETGRRDNGRRGPSDAGRNGKAAQQVWQRKHAEFTARARTAAANGNDVDAENFYQHAEHYLRMMHGSTAV